MLKSPGGTPESCLLREVIDAISLSAWKVQQDILFGLSSLTACRSKVIIDVAEEHNL